MRYTSCAFLIAIAYGISFSPSLVLAQMLAFPGAEGFGRYATGARTNLSSAQLVHVTNLNDSGPGSFREAVSGSNRFVVFDVGGIVTLDSVLTFGSNITIAGQTAPGGFVVYGDRVAFHGSNNLVSRHWSIHKGATSDKDDDAASMVRGNNMIFDHMSIAWGTDGTFDMNHDSEQLIDNITVQNSIIGQGLDHVGHSTGGLIQPGEGGSTSFIKNLWADNVTRNPKVRRENEFINNVVYGFLEHGYIMGDTDNADSWANVEGNYFIKGSNAFAEGTSRFNIYPNDNWLDNNNNGVLDGSPITSYPGATVVGTRHNFPTQPSMTAQEAVAHIIEYVGPHIVRDVVDSRMVEELASYGTLGGIINRESDLYDNYSTNPAYLNPRARLVDSDNDTMPDNWEAAHGLNSSNGNDWKNLSTSGYTQLEEYLNELGADGVTATSTSGSWTTAATWDTGVPTLADTAVVVGSVTHAGGHAFARRLNVQSNLSVTGGTIDVVDTVTVSGQATFGNSQITSGRVVIDASGQAGNLSLQDGGVLQTGAVKSGQGSASLTFDGGTFAAIAEPKIQVATVLAAGGGTIDTAAYSGQVTGVISGSGGLTKQGSGSLTLSATNSYTGPTSVAQGKLIAVGGGLGQTSGVTVAGGATLDVTAASGGLNLGAGDSLDGEGTVVGNVVAAAGAVVRPQGQVVASNQHLIAVQAEDFALSSDWAIFNSAVHGSGNGGSYDGSDLNGGGIVLVSGENTAAPTGTAAASTTVDIPHSGAWYLYVKSAEPSVSPIAGDAATQPRGNNSIYVSGLAGSLQASTSNYKEVQTNATEPSAIDAATWNRVSPSLASLSGVLDPEVAGIDYVLTSGSKTFTIHGRETGTILDGFVLSDTNLTALELETALSDGNLDSEQVLTIDGNYQQNAGATFAVDIASDARNKLLVEGTATLGGNLSVSVADGFSPQASDVFQILEASSLAGQFDNVTPGGRLDIADGVGSFQVNYDYTNDRVTLTDFMAGLPGDYNGDGNVNLADYAVWRNNLGAAAGTLPNDPNDGPIGSAQYATWKANFGSSASAVSSATNSAAVPEPGAMVLLGFASLLLAGRKLRV